MDSILDLDTRIFFIINGFNFEFLDPFMKSFTGRFIWIFLYVAIARAIWWRYGWRRALIIIAAIGIAVGLSDFICNSLIRPWVQRLRPSNLENEISAMVHVVNEYRSGRYGFPSCHAANTFALAVPSALFLRERKYTVFILLWAIMQCYTRVYLGVHYPGDIAVGATIGSLLGYGMYRLARRFVDLSEYNKKASTMPAIGVGIVLIVILIIKCAVA